MYREEEKLDSNKKESTNSPINTITVGMGQNDLIQKYGEASSQFLQALNGERYDSSGNFLFHDKRSLKEIQKYTVNPNYKEQNIKQQSGFSAERLEEANYNHDAILQGNSTRRRPTDVLGQINHPKYDHVSVDSSGHISDSSQMKFLGVDQKGRYRVIENIVKNNKWEKYDCPIDVPKDQYEKAYAYANDKYKEYLEKSQNLKASGKIEKAEDARLLAQKYKQAGKQIRPSSVTENDALQVRLNPEKYVYKNIVKDSLQAGKNAAEGAILVSGSISLVQNICAVNSGNITIQEATQNVLKTTATSGLTAYAVGSGGSILKSIMHNSKNKVIRQLGTSNFPAMVVTSALEISSVVREYINKDITATEALSRLGKSGTGTLAASYGAAVGTLLLPGIGTMLGSMVGYMISSSIYDSCLQIMKETDLARENYERTQELCSMAILAMQQQRREFESRVQVMLNQRQEAMDIEIPKLMNFIDSGDTENFTASLGSLAKAFNQQLQFKSFEEFDVFMSNKSNVLTI